MSEVARVSSRPAGCRLKFLVQHELDETVPLGDEQALRRLAHRPGCHVGECGEVPGPGIVGIGEGWTMTTCCVGWMMNVGSMRGAGCVGGMNGVGVGTGEQAGMKWRIKIAANRPALSMIEGLKLRMNRLVILP